MALTHDLFTSLNIKTKKCLNYRLFFVLLANVGLLSGFRNIVISLLYTSFSTRKIKNQWLLKFIRNHYVIYMFK